MSIPDKIRADLKSKLWSEADRLKWASLSAAEKSKWYSIWTEAANVGGKLSAFMDPRQVRVYIKDTLLKSYTRERMSNSDTAFRSLNLPSHAHSIETYIKPHGRRLGDGRVVVWGKAADWKIVLMAVHERAFNASGVPFGAVLFESDAKFADISSRLVVESAARALKIQNLVWSNLPG